MGVCLLDIFHPPHFNMSLLPCKCPKSALRCGPAPYLHLFLFYAVNAENKSGQRPHGRFDVLIDCPLFDVFAPGQILRRDLVVSDVRGEHDAVTPEGLLFAALSAVGSA